MKTSDPPFSTFTCALKFQEGSVKHIPEILVSFELVEEHHGAINQRKSPQNNLWFSHNLGDKGFGHNHNTAQRNGSYHLKRSMPKLTAFSKYLQALDQHQHYNLAVKYYLELFILIIFYTLDAKMKETTFYFSFIKHVCCCINCCSFEIS